MICDNRLDKNKVINSVVDSAKSFLKDQIGVGAHLAKKQMHQADSTCIAIEVLGYGGLAFLFCFERPLVEKIERVYAKDLGGSIGEAGVLETVFDVSNIIAGNAISGFALRETSVHLGIPSLICVPLESEEPPFATIEAAKIGMLSIGFVYL